MVKAFSKLIGRFLPGMSPSSAESTTPPPQPPQSPSDLATPPSIIAPTTASGTGRMEQQVRNTLTTPLHSAAFNKFAGATRTHPAELAAAKLAEDANAVVRVAIHDTNTLLQHHQTLSRPSRRPDPNAATRHALRTDEILASLKFEQDCFGALAQALDSLQRMDQKKLAAAQVVVTQSGAQEAKLTPLLDKRAARSGAFQAARSSDAELVAQMLERRSSWVMQQLGRSRKVDAG